VVSVGAGSSVSVINAGPAVAPDVLASLKQRFVRGPTRAEGSGLGLSIVEAIVAQAGARLDLHSPARGRDDGFEAVVTFPPAP
jgi:two-component system OmpR family sensor kinase